MPVAAEYRNVKNYIGRADDFEAVATEQLIKDYRLDYDNTNFTNTNEGYAVTKFKNTEPEKVKFAFKNSTEAPPNTKSGMLGNDSRCIFEYKMDSRNLIDGDFLEIYDSNGQLIYSYEYTTNGPNKEIGWKLIK